MNKKFYVLADSTSDLLKSSREQYDLDYLKMVFTICDKTYDADLDWNELSSDQYYSLQREGNRSITGLVKTSELEEKFEQHLKEGKDVLYIACSSRLSSSINNAKIVAEELKAKYPNNKVICYDSLRSCAAQGMLAIEASKIASEGKDIEEAIKFLDQNRLKFQTWATVGTLTYMKNAGRVKASTAFFGNLFRVKPIVVTDKTGSNVAIKKVKGRKDSLDELINIASERLDASKDYDIIVEHAQCKEDGQYVADGIKARCGKDVKLIDLGPIIGATCGPDTITINFFGQEIDFTLE